MNKAKTIRAVILAAATTAWANESPIPLVEETRVSTNADGVIRAQTIERVPLKDGQYAPWRTIHSVTREIKPGLTETVRNIVQTSLQGQPAQTIQSTQTREKTADTEICRTTEITTNAFGKVADVRIIEETTQRQPDGSLLVRVVEQGRNVHGEMTFQQEQQRRIQTISPTDTQMETRIRSFDHLRGRIDETAVQTTRIHTEKEIIRAETITRRTVGDQDRLVGRSISTETRKPDGSWQRETIEYGLGLYDRLTPPGSGELQLKRKIIERYTQQPDGSHQRIREVFRCDLNGEWKPMPFGWAGDQP